MVYGFAIWVFNGANGWLVVADDGTFAQQLNYVDYMNNIRIFGFAIHSNEHAINAE